MISSLDHFDRLILHYQSATNCREVVRGAATTWRSSSDPVELVRRFRFLEQNLGHTRYDERFKSAAKYADGIEAALAGGAQ
jgi:hypothetical protein